MFISPKIAHILECFAQLCDCMIAAFRNSGCKLCSIPIHTYLQYLQHVKLSNSELIYEFNNNKFTTN